uniref:Uncharacterized protein n=1 Tax=Lygus hesperus TaxID=30085 RepID=A0A0A9W517_LYGHE
MAEVKEHQKKKKKAWRKHLDPKDKSYMDELPPEDFKLNTVTTVNPYVFADEIDEAKREKEYRKRVELAILRREMQSRANDRQEKEFIKKVNDKSGPAWYQDLSTRQGKKFPSKTSRSSNTDSLFRSARLNMYYQGEKEKMEKIKTIKNNLERLC